MILVGSSGLGIKDLPFSDVMDYMVENNDKVLLIKLKTVAKSSNCFKIYLPDNMYGVSLYEDVMEKVTYFKDVDHLLGMLEQGDDIGPVEEEVVVDDQNGVKVFSNIDETKSNEDVIDFDKETVEEIDSADDVEDKQENVDNVSDDVSNDEEKDVEDNSNNNFVLEEIEVGIPDAFLTLPFIDDDIDSLKIQLDTKEEIINQKDALIKELTDSKDDIYKLQESQLLEMQNLYEEKVNTANETIALLKSKIREVSFDEESSHFLKYINYCKNYRAALREGLSVEEGRLLGRSITPLYIFASGSDSLYSMMKNINTFFDKKMDVVLVDFSNDVFLTTKYRIQTKESSVLLGRGSSDVVDLVKEINKVKYIPTVPHNDLVLLLFNWGTVLKKLFEYAQARPLILIFNNINNFVVRYTISKLATVGELFVFVRCNPIILNSLYSDIRFIPDNRVKIVALEYIEVVQVLLEEVSKRYKVTAFPNFVDWKKLGIKV